MLFGGKDVEDFAGQLEEIQTKQREKVKRGKGASNLSLAAQALSFSLSLARCLLWLVFTPLARLVGSTNTHSNVAKDKRKSKEGSGGAGAVRAEPATGTVL